MNVDAAIEAGVASLILKLSLACWTAITILLACDSRKVSVVPTVALSGVVIAASLSGTWGFGGTRALLPNSMWWISVVLAGIVALSSVRIWLRIAPSEQFEEMRTGLADSRKRKKRARPTRERAGPSTTSTAVQPPIVLIFAIAGWLASSSALFFGSLDLQQLGGKLLIISGIHLVSVVSLLGIAIVSAIQLSFLSSPDQIAASPKRVHWHWLARTALALAVLELLLCFLVFVAPSAEDAQDFQAGLLTRLFAFTLLVLSYTTWMIPHRVASFQASGTPKGWTSLAIASWLCALALAVVCALPASWPWRVI